MSGNRHEKLLGHSNIFCVSSTAQQSHGPVVWLPTAANTWAQSFHSTGHLQANDVTLPWGSWVQSSPLRKKDGMRLFRMEMYTLKLKLQNSFNWDNG